MPIQTFLSYSTKDKDTAGLIKHSLEFCGFDVFLAHEELKVSKEWSTEIMRQLKRCKVLVPLLTKDFNKSSWTHQEVGVALARNVVIASIKVNIQPPGFLAKYQYVSMKGGDIQLVNEACSKVASSVAAEHRKLRPEIRKALVANVEGADTYFAGGAIISALESIGGLTTRQINAVVRQARQNDQVYGAYLARGPLRNLIRKYRERINVADLAALHQVWPYTEA